MNITLSHKDSMIYKCFSSVYFCHLNVNTLFLTVSHFNSRKRIKVHVGHVFKVLSGEPMLQNAPLTLQDVQAQGSPRARLRRVHRALSEPVNG